MIAKLLMPAMIIARRYLRGMINSIAYLRMGNVGLLLTSRVAKYHRVD